MRILDDVARDVGELEGDAEVGGAVERVAVRRVDAHDMRHHHPDRAGDLVAIATADPPRSSGVQPAASRAKPARWSWGKSAGMRVSAATIAKRVERDEPGRLAGERGVGLGAEEGDAAPAGRRR